MKALGMVVATFVGMTLTAVAGRGDGGPPTVPPSDTGGGTTGGTTPEPSFSEWKARVLAAYADGALDPSERREINRFLRSVPPHNRLRYLLSWIRLQTQVARSANPAVVSGVVATWAYTDPDAAAEWLNGLPGR
ncbi:hypothetical protein [Luteolibacter soli]|uniref:DUF3106 domain-containing protein n=1 Tax=Luteolibacter soli TaxID=3135280 RepID=A0ABU9AU99_9BACT